MQKLQLRREDQIPQVAKRMEIHAWSQVAPVPRDSCLLLFIHALIESTPVLSRVDLCKPP